MLYLLQIHSTLLSHFPATIGQREDEMKRKIKIIAIVLLMVPSLSFAQQQPNNDQKEKMEPSLAISRR